MTFALSFDWSIATASATLLFCLSAFVILSASKSKEITSHSYRNDSIEKIMARSQLQI